MHTLIGLGAAFAVVAIIVAFAWKIPCFPDMTKGAKARASVRLDMESRYAAGDELVFLPTGRKVGFASVAYDMRLQVVYEDAQGRPHVLRAPADQFKPTGWKVPVREGV